MLNAKFINRNGLGKDALSLSVASAKSVIPFFDFEICGRSRSVKVMTGLLQDRRRRSKSSLGSTEHPAKYMLKHLTMNELRFNQTSGGAKPVKVCQSMKGQGARGLARSRTLRAIRRADSDAAAFLPLTHPGTSFIRCQKIKVDQGCSRWLKVNQGILKHFFMGRRAKNAWTWPGSTARPELLRQGQINRIGARAAVAPPGSLAPSINATILSRMTCEIIEGSED